MIKNIPGHKHPLDAYYLMRGLSPRLKNGYHMVVGQNGKMVHDPHPDKTGIIGDAAHFIYFIDISPVNSL